MSSPAFVRILLLLGALTALPVLLVACGSVPEEPTVPVDDGPPPPQVEEAPAIGDPQTQIWRPGYWSLSGQTFVWVSGKIIPRPSPTAVWAPARWVLHEYGWSFEQGHWE